MNNPFYFKNQYRVSSIRLKYYDYRNVGAYFVAICVDKRKCLLGKMGNDKVLLSAIGKVVEKCWLEIPEHFFNTKLDVHVVMPNHIHGIVIINHNPGVETRDLASLQSQVNQNKFGPLVPKSLSSIIHAYKAAVTRWRRKNGYTYFAWQERFYEHMIRNEESFAGIREYIVNNPLKWEEDRNNPNNFLIFKPRRDARSYVSTV